MKKTVLLFAAVVLWVTPAGADEVVRSFRQQIPVGGAREISLEFPVGEVEVEAWDNPQVGIHLQLACNRGGSRCAKAAEAVRLVYNTSGDRLRVEVKNWPKFGGRNLHVIARIEVPRDLPLWAELGIGELTIEGTASDLTVDLGIGEANITLPKEAIGSVGIDTGIGEASLIAGGRRHASAGLMTRELRWNEGAGRAAVTANCGIGEIDVTLR